MKTSTTLGLLLTASVILNAYLFFNKKPGGDPDCIKTEGYGEPHIVDVKVAQGYANEYKASMKEPDGITGGFITRDAFDEMLCIEGCNGIAYSLAIDSTGTNGPGGSGVFVIFAPASVKPGTSTQAAEVRSLSSSYYLPRPWCPPNCILAK